MKSIVRAMRRMAMLGCSTALAVGERVGSDGAGWTDFVGHHEAHVHQGP